MECASWPVSMHPCAQLNDKRACGFTFGFEYAICEFAFGK